MREFVRLHKRNILLCIILAILSYSFAAILLTWPLVKHPGKYYFNPEIPHDGIGIISESWYSNYARSQGLKGTRTKFFGYPFGVNRKEGNPLSNGLITQIAKFSNPIFGYNVLLILSFPLAGISMFLLLYHITADVYASFLGGFFYAFSPWHVFRTFDQLSLAGIHCLPFFILCLLLFIEKASLMRGIALALATAVSALTDIHLALFSGFLALCVIIAIYFYGRLVLRKRKFPLCGKGKEIIASLLIFLIALAFCYPALKNVFYKDPDVPKEAQERGIEETISFSARPWYYVIPPYYTLIWGRITKGFIEGKLASQKSGEVKQGIHEVACYPGIIVLLLAALSIWILFKKGKPRELVEEKCGNSRVVTAQILGLLAVFLGFILSMPPMVKVSGFELPTPSIVMRAIAPQLRFYSRWALVVSFGLCLLSGIGFFIVEKKFRSNRGKFIAIFLALLLLFSIDVTIVPPSRVRDISRPPEVIHALSRIPKKEAVCLYPVNSGIYYMNIWYRYYQTFFKRPMFNGSKPGTEGDLYAVVVKDIYAPYTPRMLKGLGIRKAVVLKSYFKEAVGGKGFCPELSPDGIKLFLKTKDGFIYDIVAEPATLYPLFYTNFTSSSFLGDMKVWTVMIRRNASILIMNRGETQTARFMLDFYNPGEANDIDLELNGRSVGKARLVSQAGTLEVQGLNLKKGKNVLNLFWSGKPVLIDGTPFRAKTPLPAYLLFSRPRFE